MSSDMSSDSGSQEKGSDAHQDAAGAVPDGLAVDESSTDQAEGPSKVVLHDIVLDIPRRPAGYQDYGSGKTHDPDGRPLVILRLEHLTDKEGRTADRIVLVAEAVAMLSLVPLLAMKYCFDKRKMLRVPFIEIWNVVAASLYLCIMVSLLVSWARHILHTWRRNAKWLLNMSPLRQLLYGLGLLCARLIASAQCLVPNAPASWDHRRKGIVIYHTAELLVHTVNTGLYLGANAYVLAAPCSWWGQGVAVAGVLRWSCWFTVLAISVIQTHNCCQWEDKWWLKVPEKFKLATPRPIIMDRPARYHWPKLVVLLVFIGLLALFYVYVSTDVFFKNVTCETQSSMVCLERPPTAEEAKSCRTLPYECHSSGRLAGFSVVFIVSLLWFYAWFLWRAWQANSRLKEVGYTAYRTVSVGVRLQLRLRQLAFSIMIMATLVLWFSSPGTCASYFETWLGLFPTHTVFVAVMVVTKYMWTPQVGIEIDPKRLEAQMHQFSWTEESSELQAAAETGTSHFCFETALKAFYWSRLVYRMREPARKSAGSDSSCRRPSLCQRGSSKSLPDSRPSPRLSSDASQRSLTDELSGLGSVAESGEGLTHVRRSPGAAKRLAQRYNIDLGLKLYNLQHHRVVWDRESDTKAVIGWGDSAEQEARIVLAFRGTASMTNLLSDFQVWQAPYPKRVKRQWHNHCLPRPRVHQGFLNIWLGFSLREQVLACLREGLQDLAPEQGCRVLTVGHSLGGALAQLAAHDIALDFRDQHPKLHVSCYSMGAPRLGNTAFADHFGKLGIDCWSMVNDQDAVARQGKFLGLYKRPGERVLIRSDGDMLVSPAFIEAALWRRVGHSKLKHHLMAEYQKSLAAVIERYASIAQASKEGRQALLGMTERNGTRELFEDVFDLNHADVLRFVRQGGKGLLLGKERKCRFARLRGVKPSPSLADSADQDSGRHEEPMQSVPTTPQGSQQRPGLASSRSSSQAAAIDAEEDAVLDEDILSQELGQAKSVLAGLSFRRLPMPIVKE